MTAVNNSGESKVAPATSTSECALSLCIDDERLVSESNTHWKLRRAFLEKFKDDFPEDRLRSLSMIFCNVIFLNCSYSPVMMKKVEDFSLHLHHEIQVAKGIQRARKSFSLPSLDSDEEDISFNINQVLAPDYDNEIFYTSASKSKWQQQKSKKREALASAQITANFSSMKLGSKGTSKKQTRKPSPVSTSVMPGVFHISVLEGGSSGASEKKTPKKKNKKKNKQQQQSTIIENRLDDNKSSAKESKSSDNGCVPIPTAASESNETVQSTRTEDVFLNIKQNSSAGKKSKEKSDNKKKNNSNFKNKSNNKNDKVTGGNDSAGKNGKKKNRKAKLVQAEDQ